MFSSSFQDSTLVDSKNLPPSTGENQVVTLRAPEFAGPHLECVLDVLRPHLHRRRKDEAKAIGELLEISEYVDHAVFAVLGGYGAGKTTVACEMFLLTCLRNLRHDGYGGDFPRAYCVAPTTTILHDTAIHRLEAITPAALVSTRTKTPWSMQLINGVVVAGKSADAALEGFEGFALYAEEIQHENYWRDPMLWPNYIARIRDPFATVRRIIVAGLPTAGSVRAQFDKPTVRIHHLPTNTNPAIDDATMESIRQACPMGQEESLLGGDWMQPQGAVFAQFNAARHLVPTGYEPRLPVHMSIDVGNHSAAVWFQVRAVPCRGITGHVYQQPGIIVVDDLVTHRQSVEDLMTAAKVREYQLTKGSVICMDPTVRADERQVVKKHFPGLPVIQLDKNDPYYFIEEGIRLMQSAMGDTFGNVRFHVLENLRRTRNGVVTALQSAKRDQKSGIVIKDDRTDHARDALRYAVCFALGRREGPKEIPAT